MRVTPKHELEHRISRFQEALGEAGLDGALIIQNVDLYYFSGTCQMGQLFVPARGSPVLAIKKNFERARCESTLDKVFQVEGFDGIRALLHAHGFKRLKRLGLELDVLPAGTFLRLRSGFEDVEFVDCSRLIRRVRSVKSEYEIGLQRQASDMNARMFLKVPEILEEGLMEVELAGQLEAVLRSLGHQGPVRTRRFNQESFYGHLLAGENIAVRSMVDGPTGGSGVSPAYPQGCGLKRIGRGEPILVDYVAITDGYIVDEARVFCLGELPDVLRKAHDCALRIQSRLVELGRPGVSCEELYRAACAVAEEARLLGNFMGVGNDRVSFVGHGVGLELDELPVLAEGSRDRLEEGMVVALEPKFLFPGTGGAGIENTFVVREDGLKRFSRIGDDIVSID